MQPHLFTQFVVSSIMLVICVAIHGLGLFSLNRALHSEASIERLEHTDPLSRRGAIFTLSIVVALIALHGIEIWLFAVFYLVVGAVANLEQALYFSTISYSTVGYSDMHIAIEWRLTGAFESIMGVILLGWSTAFFFRMLSRIDSH
ncbi:hypothetical protein MB02_10905 [Croceicoccus estronivorus]|uniref:ion channel n=1 Tax=Croceicoccus estronivorus TaxID=1172626 RepID=UPI0008346E1D|nr:ion channel [Croceicoccus estronivorus]OCC23666.1 hypothetical protein MB02_10905 [Croceicoccus estronivorus]